MSESGDNQVAAEVMADGAAAKEVVEIPKERIKRPTRPDDAAHKQKTEALQAVSKFLVKPWRSCSITFTHCAASQRSIVR